MQKHDTIVRELYSKLREELNGGEVLIKKGDKTTRIGEIITERRHYSGEGGAPDIVVKIIIDKLCEVDISGEFPILIEVEEASNTAIMDFCDFCKEECVEIPCIVVTEDRERKAPREINTKVVLNIRCTNYPLLLQ